MYIEKLENLAEPYIMFLRPRKFGKTLFTSTLENYYDIQKEAKEQIKEYGEFEEIKELKNIYKYTVVAVNDKIYVEEIV